MNKKRGKILGWIGLFLLKEGINQNITTAIKNRMDGLATESEPSNEATSGILVIGKTAIIAYQQYSAAVLISLFFKF